MPAEREPGSGRKHQPEGSDDCDTDDGMEGGSDNCDTAVEPAEMAELAETIRVRGRVRKPAAKGPAARQRARSAQVEATCLEEVPGQPGLDQVPEGDETAQA